MEKLVTCSSCGGQGGKYGPGKNRTVQEPDTWKTVQGPDTWKTVQEPGTWKTMPGQKGSVFVPGRTRSEHVPGKTKREHVPGKMKQVYAPGEWIPCEVCKGSGKITSSLGIVKGISVKPLARIEYKQETAFDWEKKGRDLHNQGKYHEAVQAYDKAIELDPENGRLWRSKGISLHKLGRSREASEAFNKGRARKLHI